jgi:hypothetical protein
VASATDSILRAAFMRPCSSSSPSSTRRRSAGSRSGLMASGSASSPSPSSFSIDRLASLQDAPGLAEDADALAREQQGGVRLVDAEDGLLAGALLAELGDRHAGAGHRLDVLDLAEGVDGDDEVGVEADRDAGAGELLEVAAHGVDVDAAGRAAELEVDRRGVAEGVAGGERQVVAAGLKAGGERGRGLDHRHPGEARPQQHGLELLDLGVGGADQRVLQAVLDDLRAVSCGTPSGRGP